MARLVIRILPNAHPTDPSLTPLRTQEGDVVEIVDDGHAFSFAELNCGHYRMVDVPGVLPEDLEHLRQHVEDSAGKMVKRRKFMVDLQANLTLPPLTDVVHARVDHRDQARQDAIRARHLAEGYANDISRHAHFAKLAKNSDMVATVFAEEEAGRESKTAMDNALKNQADADTAARQRGAHPVLKTYVDEAVVAVNAITRIRI